MSKRQRSDDTEEQPQKKLRKGFTVGPDHLPDGTYKRKTQKIKNDLIQKAKVKKAYAKIKAQEEIQDNSNSYDPYASLDNEQPSVNHEGTPSGNTLEIHPERQAMLNEPEPLDRMADGASYRSRDRSTRRQTSRFKRRDKEGDENMTGGNVQSRHRPERYRKEFAEAKEREKLQEAKQQRRDIRDKDRRAMIKAKKPGKDGRQKLGRQGTVLLGRVQRLMGEGKI